MINLRLNPKASITDHSKVSVVLLNMGGPRTLSDLGDFQFRLFSDPLLIRFPLSFLFQKIFAWALVTFRLKASQQRYQLIGGGSPIFLSTQNQSRSLKEELKKRHIFSDVTFCFNYSEPFPQDVIRSLKDKGIRYILPLSLYPHYSKATTGSNMFYLEQAAHKIDPNLKFLPMSSYHLHDGYIEAFSDRIREQLRPGESLDEFYLIFSAHGLPVYFLMEGDPYPFEISQTVAKILGKLNRRDQWVISYQSAVGPMKWLGPSTGDVLKILSKEGVKKVLVVPIAFVSDHIETICEIDIEYRHFARQLGIENFRMSKAIECHPKFIETLADSVEEVLAGVGASDLTHF